MTGKFWKKFEKLEEISEKNSNTKTYSERIKVIVKEIKTKDKYDFIRISLRLEEIKQYMI